jgi:O-antigen/teichoic acid export membrane protein
MTPVTAVPEDQARSDAGRTIAGLIPEMEHLRRWAPRGVLAVLDQGLISGANFLLGVSLARSGGPESYGAYMIVFAAFLLIANVHQAILIEPASVLAFSLFPQRNDRYLRTVLLMHAIFTAGFVLVAGCFWLLAPRFHITGALANAVAGLVIVTPCVLLFWLSRSFAYLDFAPGRAVVGSSAYCAAVMTGIVISYLRGHNTPLSAFSWTAAAAVIASAVLLRHYRRMRPPAGTEPGLRTVWTRHWRFGRWGLSSVGLNWAQTNSISLISGWLLGLRATGGLNALVGLLLPMFQVLISASRVVLPRVAQIYTLKGLQATRRPIVRVGITLFLLTSGYWLLLAVAHRPLLQIIYGAKFMPYAYLVPIISLHLVACSIMAACDLAFNAMQSPQSSFPIKMAIVAIMIPTNTFLMWRFGLLGAAIGVPVFSAASGIWMAAKVRQIWRRGENSVLHGAPASAVVCS